MDFMQIIQQYWYIIAVFGVLIIGSVFFSVINMRKMKDVNQKFLAEHPDAAKIYLTNKTSITQENVTVYSVNVQTPQGFMEGTKNGIYLVPGRSTLQLSYTYTRPGVMYKSVSKTTDMVEQMVEVAPYKTYQLGFDRKAETFTFEEI